MLPQAGVPPLVRWSGVALLLTLCVIAAWRLDLRALGRALAGAAPLELALAMTGCVVSMVLQTARWLSVAHPVAPGVRGRDAFLALSAGYAVGLVLPARASDLVRGILAAERAGVSAATLTATAVVDHLLASVALFAALGASAAAAPLPPWLRSGAALAGVSAAVTLAVMMLLRPRPGSAPPPPGWRGLLARLRVGLAATGRPAAIARALAWALAGWGVELLTVHLCLRAFGLPAGEAPCAAVMGATTLSAALSISPGNAGAFELAAVLALGAFGVASEPAAAFALAYHAIHLVPVAVVGGGWLLLRGLRPAAAPGRAERAT